MLWAMYKPALSLVFCLACAGHRRQGSTAPSGPFVANDEAGNDAVSTTKYLGEIGRSPDQEAGRSLAMMLVGLSAPAAFNVPSAQWHAAAATIDRPRPPPHLHPRGLRSNALHLKMNLLDEPIGRARRIRGARQYRQPRQVRQPVDNQINITRTSSYGDIVEARRVIEGIGFEPDSTFKCSVLFVAKQGMEVRGAIFLTPKVFDYAEEAFRPLESLQETPLRPPYEQIVFVGRKNFLAVHKDFRGLQLGPQLMAAAESYVKQIGAPEIILEIPRSALATHLYEQRGYRRIGQVGAFSPFFDWSFKDRYTGFECVCKRLGEKA